ncbi:MAG: glycosyltransferase family 2 protein [Selenomonadaceae bacterium]|nr:glycosyltransferase family 2 protein [Selenomonadaceae bacterium]
MSKSKNKQHKTNDEQPAVPTQAQPVQQVPRLPAVSVILPMYNSARYIRSCVESVLNQTFGLFELICVDDCSTDDTVKIVAEMAQKDGRIRVVRLAKNTGGASEPRNTGLRLSRGKYIAFLDSDDMYTRTALAELVSVAEKWNADVVHTEQVYFPENETIDVTPETKFTTFSKELGGFCKEPMLETDNLAQRVQMFYKGRFFGWVHNKLYRRDLLMEKNIRFDKLMTSEDIIFYFRVLCTAPRIVRVPNIIYIYRHNPNSITRKMVSVEESLHVLTHLMIEGSKVLDDFMSGFQLFVKNPQLRQLPIDYIIQQHLIWTQRFYEKYTTSQLDALVRKELKKYCGDFVPFFAYIYGAIHTYRKRLINYDKQIKQLKAQVGGGQVGK